MTPGDRPGCRGPSSGGMQKPWKLQENFPCHGSRLPGARSGLGFRVLAHSRCDGCSPPSSSGHCEKTRKYHENHVSWTIHGYRTFALHPIMKQQGIAGAQDGVKSLAKPRLGKDGKPKLCSPTTLGVVWQWPKAKKCALRGLPIEAVKILLWGNSVLGLAKPGGSHLVCGSGCAAPIRAGSSG